MIVISHSVLHGRLLKIITDQKQKQKTTVNLRKTYTIVVNFLELYHMDMVGRYDTEHLLPIDI